MRIGYRHADPRFGFLWENAAQPAARWHGVGEGPAQYLADTPDGAWAEYLRHEEITEPADIDGIDRAVWVVQLDEADLTRATSLPLPADLGPDGYADCQAAARTARAGGATVVIAPSAALRPGRAGGQVCDGGLQPAPAADGDVWVLFGPRPDLRGWQAATGYPSANLLPAVRPLA